MLLMSSFTWKNSVAQPQQNPIFLDLLKSNARTAMLRVRKVGVAIQPKNKRASPRLGKWFGKLELCKFGHVVCSVIHDNFFSFLQLMQLFKPILLDDQLGRVLSKVVMSIPSQKWFAESQAIRPSANVTGRNLSKTKQNRKQCWRNHFNYHHTFPWDYCPIGLMLIVFITAVILYFSAA